MKYNFCQDQDIKKKNREVIRQNILITPVQNMKTSQLHSVLMYSVH